MQLVFVGRGAVRAGVLAVLSAAGCAALTAALPARDPVKEFKDRMAGGTVQDDSLSSGLVTDTGSIDEEPPGYRVSWIKWDSGFRGSGLQIGDRIIAVEGERVTRPTTLEERQRQVQKAIGQSAENQRWSERGTTDGTVVTVTVRRRAPSGEGTATLDVRGVIAAQRIFSNGDGRRLTGPGGPDEMANDGFDGAWSGWYEGFVRRCTKVLDGGWQSTMASRYELTQHLDDKARVDYLVAHYPGPYAKATQEDFEAVRVSLVGRRYDIDAAALAYRQLGEQRAADVAGAGKKARDALVQTLAAQTIAPFPTIDPIRGDRRKVAGKVLVLPPIANRDWVSEAGHGYLAWGNRDSGWYFLDSYAPSAGRVFDALYRYRKYVSPQIDETYAIIARIQQEPKMLVIDGRAATGLSIEALGATVGNKMFVDVTKANDKESPFAGEEALRKAPDITVPNDASPRQVMEAFVAAIKNDDEKTWKSLYATWWAEKWHDDGQVIWYPYYEYRVEDGWVDSRRLILDRVYDARVVYVSDIEHILTGKELPKAPIVDQVLVEIDHVGLFDGEYHAFSDVGVHRRWTLQRVNGGPWRITSVQGL